MEKSRKKKIIHAVAALCTGAVVIVVLVGVWLYVGPASGFRLQVLALLRAPLGTVGSEYITVEGLRNFSDSLETQNLAAAVPALIYALQVQSVAASQGLRIGLPDIERTVGELRAGDEQYRNFEARFGAPAALRVLAMPYMYKNYLETEYVKQGLEPALTQRLQTLSRSLRTDEDWKVAASEYSDDLASSWSGGDVGYVDLNRAIPEYAQAVQGLPLHNPAVIYTRYGAHIVEVLNRVAQPGGELTQLREIVLRPKHFDAWLAEQTSAVPVKWYVQLPTSIEAKN